MVYVQKVKLNLAEQYKTEPAPEGRFFVVWLYSEYTVEEPILSC